MKLKSIFSTALLAALMIMPMIVNAADRDDKQNRRQKDSYSSRKRNDDRRDNDRRDNDRQDNDRWDQNGGHDNGNHNGWDKNGKSGYGSYSSRHDDWHRSSRTTHRDDCRYDGGNWRQYDTRYHTRYDDRYGNDRYGNYNTRHDDWHRSSRTTHRDDCRYDGGNWRQQDTRYNTRYNDPYYNDRYRNDPYDNDRYRNDPYYGGGYEYDRREQTKNEWKNLGIAGGLLAVLGLLNNDSTLTFAGTAGALYSAYRYEQDRKSQNRTDRARAYYFSQPYFTRDGHRYERRDVNRNGQRYYQFVRCD